MVVAHCVLEDGEEQGGSAWMVANDLFEGVHRGRCAHGSYE